ncbi:MAG: two-component regulator propeller domain-containing protein, partial [Bacteroidota bacterium]
MRQIVSLLLYGLFLLPYSSSAQEYSYTHYDIGDGLAGSTVFCITQDKDGFIWTGTETGVSRFDGTHFKTFSIADGLPDVEVLQMYGDSKGRVWMAPFRRSVCYYYKGRIYNQENDSCLKKIHLKGTVQSFAEDRNGNILIQEYNALHLLSVHGQVKEYDSIDHHPIHDCAAISASFSGHFLVQENRHFYELSDDNFRPLFDVPFTMILQRYIALTPQWVAWRESTYKMGLRSVLTGKELHFHFPQDHVTFTILDDSLLYSNETTGSREYNIHTGASKTFLPGVEVSRTFRDDEGNTWFTTLGQGLFRLNSDEFINIHLQAGNYDKCPVYSLLKVGKDLYAGSGRNLIFRFGLPDLRDRRHAAILNEEGGGGHVLYMDTLQDGNIIFGMDYLVGKLSRDLRFSSLLIGAHVKTGFRKNERDLLVTSSRGCTIFDTRIFRFKDTVFRERSTAVFSRNDSTYIGTLNGLYLVKKDRSVTYMGDEIPFFKKRISAITEAKDHTLWVAAYDDGGIIGYKQGRVVAALTRKQGLTS